MHASTTLRLAAAWALASMLSACATPTKPMYQWGAYPSALYSYLKGDVADPGAQIQQLEAQARRAVESGAAAPPGLHGHLALLYSKLGDDANAVRHLEIERKLFPESAAYIGFLLERAARPAPKS